LPLGCLQAVTVKAFPSPEEVQERFTHWVSFFKG
jgi:hypothetical protein